VQVTPQAPQFALVVKLTQLPPQHDWPEAQHVLPQATPLAHVNPHIVPSQVAAAFAGGMQAVHDVVPQLLMLVLDTQAVPQR